MSMIPQSPNRTLKAKKKAPANEAPSRSAPGNSAPTTFFFKSERDVHPSASRGRRISRDLSPSMSDSQRKAPMGSMSGDGSSYGVQSLEDAISASYSESSSLSRTNSNATDENAAPGAEPSGIIGRKRKAGNPVHPRIAAAGQRIISSEQPPTYTSATGSPVSMRSAESPLRTHMRRGSGASSINLSQPLTPLKGSPHNDASGLPSTPRTGSPKSFRLSDEEISVASDSGSQAIASSSGEEDDDAHVSSALPAATPQLVMPSIAMPARRPFTEKGRRMGRLKVMVIGPKGVGKTSLIRSICRVCEDVVHVDPIATSSTPAIHEIGASTKPYPPWRSDVETSQRLRRASITDNVLERNITFVDTPGLNEGGAAQLIRDRVSRGMSRVSNMQQLTDAEISDMLGGEGGPQIDAALFVCDPLLLSQRKGLHHVERELLRDLKKCMTVIPILGRCDTVASEELEEVKQSLRSQFEALGVVSGALRAYERAENTTQLASRPSEPLAVSSALEDDAETMEASVLMSSTYLQPLMPSELTYLVQQLLAPDNIARLRHLSANKLVLWRQAHVSRSDLPKQTLLTFPQSAPSSPALASTSDSALPNDPSKVLVPHASSSYFRSVSPSASESSSGPKHTLDHITEPFSRVRLAKWAQDLRRSLDNERRRYKQMYANAPSEWASLASDSEKQALVAMPNTVPAAAEKHGSRPAKGRLGGEIGVIDPRDPLGLLAFGQTFRRRGWFALQIAGGCGLVGAVAWWVIRNWVEVQDWFGFGGGSAAGGTALTGGMDGRTISLVAVPAPTREVGHTGWLEEGMRGARQWEGWVKEAVGVGR